MKKLFFLLFLITVSLACYTQTPSWNIDENYTYTKFFDDFSNPALPDWRPNFIYRGIGQMIDSTLTHRVQNGKLELTMARVQNYNDSANFVGQEFWTNQDFSFGIFECKATFAKGLGSWPAFWAFSGGGCLNNNLP